MSPSRCPHVPIPSHLGPNPQLHSQALQQPAGNAFGNSQLAVILGVINNNNQTGGWVEVSPWPRHPPSIKMALCVCVWRGGGAATQQRPQFYTFQWVKALKETFEAQSPKLSSSGQTKRCFGELLLGFSQHGGRFFLHILTDATLHTPRSLMTTDPTIGPSGAQSSTGTAPGTRPRHGGWDGGRGCGGTMRRVGPPQRGLGQGPSWPARRWAHRNRLPGGKWRPQGGKGGPKGGDPTRGPARAQFCPASSPRAAAIFPLWPR